MLNETILMRKIISGACKDLNYKQSRRYKERQVLAHNLNLNFRLSGHTISKHSIEHMKSKYPGVYTLNSGICLCCSLPSYICTCKIEVKDSNGNISYIEV